jgi:hypothetical protein
MQAWGSGPGLVLIPRVAKVLGSARVSRVGFGVAPKQFFPNLILVDRGEHTQKVRDREDAITPAGAGRDACATQNTAPRHSESAITDYSGVRESDGDGVSGACAAWHSAVA